MTCSQTQLRKHTSAVSVFQNNRKYFVNISQNSPFTYTNNRTKRFSNPTEGEAEENNRARLEYKRYTLEDIKGSATRKTNISP
jgi:hypothetical protein